MGKSTISMAIFNSYVANYQRVTDGSSQPPWLQWLQGNTILAPCLRRSKLRKKSGTALPPGLRLMICIYIYTPRSVHLGLMLVWNGHAWKHLETLDVKPLGIWGVLDRAPAVRLLFLQRLPAPRSHLRRQPSTQCSAQPHDFNRTAQHCRTEDGGSGAQKGKTGEGPKRRSVECLPGWSNLRGFLSSILLWYGASVISSSMFRFYSWLVPIIHCWIPGLVLHSLVITLCLVYG